MSDNPRARRTARIIGYLKEGRPTGEICDLEGLDPTNAPNRIRHEIAVPNGLPMPTKKNSKPPVGLLDLDRQFRSNLQGKLQRLRDYHNTVDVSHMLGMTNIEQQRALKHPYTHNWTIAQIQRLAAATDTTFEALMTYVLTFRPPDYRKKK